MLVKHTIAIICGGGQTLMYTPGMSEDSVDWPCFSMTRLSQWRHCHPLPVVFLDDKQDVERMWAHTIFV